MTKTIYNKVQIDELKNNIYVKNVTEKHIVFNKECKIKAIELSVKYISSKEIFRKLGFPEYIINSDIPKSSLSRWKRNINKKGVIEEKKGRPKAEKTDFDNMTKDEYIELLETKLAVFEELRKYTEGKFP